MYHSTAQLKIQASQHTATQLTSQAVETIGKPKAREERSPGP